jgi:RNA-directed DNA polymerase
LTREAEVASWVADRLVRDFTPTPEETVSANKARHALRPVAVWDLPSRLAYRALVNKLQPSLPPLVRGGSSWPDFRRRPLGRPGKYIVATDIAACYQGIDHGLLSRELLLQTGGHEVVETLVALLAQCGRRRYGLPQQSRPSDVLAESFLARLERALVRRRLTVDRYNDDFRFTCATWSDVIRSLEVFDEEARAVGLTVNEHKTFPWKRASYEAHLDAAEKLRLDIAEEAKLDLTQSDNDPYSGEPTTLAPEAEDVDLLSAVRVLERWKVVAGRGRVAARRGAEYVAVLDLLPVALKRLEAERGSPEDVMEHCRGLLRYERTLTPAVASYLLSRLDEEPVLDMFDAMRRGRTYVNGWQTWWLQKPVARLEGFSKGQRANGRLSWARRAFTSAEHSPVLRAEAARTLARHGQIEVDELMGVYDRSSDIVRPVLAAAIALRKPNADVRKAVVGDNKLNEWSYDWSAQFA